MCAASLRSGGRRIFSQRRPPVALCRYAALRAADGQHQLGGQLPYVLRADRALGLAVLGDWQDDRHRTIGVGPHGDPPANVAALLKPLGLLDRSSGRREGVVPKGLEADTELLAEPQLEGEDTGAAM